MFDLFCWLKIIDKLTVFYRTFGFDKATVSQSSFVYNIDLDVCSSNPSSKLLGYNFHVQNSTFKFNMEHV